MVDKVDASSPLQARRNENLPIRTAEPGSPGRSATQPIPDTENPRPDWQSGSTYEQLRQRVGETGDIDRQRVEDIKAAIRRGDFTIDAQRVARAVVDLEQLLAD